MTKYKVITQRFELRKAVTNSNKYNNINIWKNLLIRGRKMRQRNQKAYWNGKI